MVVFKVSMVVMMVGVMVVMVVGVVEFLGFWGIISWVKGVSKSRGSIYKSLRASVVPCSIPEIFKMVPNTKLFISIDSS